MSQPPIPEPGWARETTQDPPGARWSDTELAAEVAAFIADLRALRAGAGAPSYARLARLTGLARSTLHDGLRGSRLPSLQLTLGVVRACRGDQRQWHERWARLRRRLDDPGTGSPPAGPAAAPATALGEPRRRSRRRLRGVAVVAALVLLAAGAGAAVMGLVDHGRGERCESARLYRADQAGAVLDADGHPVGRVEPGDTVRVGSLRHDRYAHRYYGTVQRTNTTGYLDEAKLTFVRQVCG